MMSESCVHHPDRVCGWCVLDQPVTSPERPSNKQPGTTPDNVNNPAHYNQGAVECIDAIESALGAEGFRSYCRGNAMKYCWRSEHKGSPVQDIQKAIWYLKRLESTYE